jgi:hypothetical protein
MKRFTRYAIGTILVLGMSSAWAQQRDLEVTMDVVPANASTGAAREIKLPITLDSASPRGQESSSFGRATADLARDKDLSGRDFGDQISGEARNQIRTPNLPPQSRRP